MKKTAIQELIDYLHEQFPATQGHIPLTALIEKVASDARQDAEHRNEKLEIQVIEMWNDFKKGDFKKGDFTLPRLAQLDLQSCIETIEANRIERAKEKVEL